MTETPTLVSIIVVSYNTRQMTVECIESVYRFTGSNRFEVVVVDNASSDGSADAIAHAYPAVRLIRSKINLGFGKANNLAANETTGKYILLLNSDTLILDNAIHRLIEFADDNPEAGIWGGRTEYADGRLNPSSCWRFVSLRSLLFQATGLANIFSENALLNPEAYGGWARNNVRQVDIVTGCFLLITRSLWSELRGFDEDFFMYAEEADLCFRAAQAGALPRFTPAASIIHYDGASETVRAQKMIRLFTGKVTFMLKHWKSPRKIIGISLLKMHSLTRLTAYWVLSYVVSNSKFSSSAKEWREIWGAREIWEKGYPSK